MFAFFHLVAFLSPVCSNFLHILAILQSLFEPICLLWWVRGPPRSRFGKDAHGILIHIASGAAKACFFRPRGRGFSDPWPRFLVSLAPKSLFGTSFGIPFSSFWLPLAPFWLRTFEEIVYINHRLVDIDDLAKIFNRTQHTFTKS